MTLVSKTDEVASFASEQN